MEQQENLQSLITEHGNLLELKNIAADKLQKEEITEAEYLKVSQLEENYPGEKVLSAELKVEFEQYKQVCFLNYENALTNLMGYFQVKEESPEELKNSVITVTGDEETDNKAISKVEQNLFESFFATEDNIAEYVKANNLVLPESIKRIYGDLGNAIEDEYTDWLANKAYKVQQEIIQITKNKP